MSLFIWHKTVLSAPLSHSSTHFSQTRKPEVVLPFVIFQSYLFMSIREKIRGKECISLLFIINFYFKYRFFSNYSTMINGFPAEIITEILLYLPLYDLIQLLKSNRRTFNIARHEHSIMKHRLSNRRYTHVKVVGCSSEKFLEMIKKQQQNHPELVRNKPHNYVSFFC